MPSDEHDAPAPVVLVVMGVSGAGKTTVGRRIAERLGWPFFEGDDLHPDANVEKMKGGEPLADADRQPWLEEIRDLAARLLAEERSAVIACSALKEAYRDLIGVKAGSAMRFLYLEGHFAQIEKRLDGRSGHYMPTDLLQSQFDALEEPDPDADDVLAVNVDQPPDAVVDETIQWLRSA
jgi:gluconokinase